MSWVFLFFLAEPWFVLPWYAIGLLAMWFVIYDQRTSNTALEPAMKWAWPIIVLFFSFVGLALYFGTARPPGVGTMPTDEDKATSLQRYASATWRRVNGAVIHCVAGDGLGILMGMVIARAAGMSFWQEFWFEYAVGFAIGWLVFQRKSMTAMSGSLTKQLALAFRAEFFSMLTVMGGMGAVMTYVTPMVATAQPKPLTYGFWGFSMLGLLAGYVLTYPMSWLLLAIGWKHGMGAPDEARQVYGRARTGGLLAAMVVLGAAGLCLPAWLTAVREHAPTRGDVAAVTPEPGRASAALFEGLRTILGRGDRGLRLGQPAVAAMALDDALRAAEAGTHSAPGAFYSASEEVRQARLAVQNGDPRAALAHVDAAVALLEPPRRDHPPILDARRYRGAAVINPEGALIGEVVGVGEGALTLALGGWRDVWGFVDVGAARHVVVPVAELAFGPPRRIGRTLVVVPTQRQPGVALPDTGGVVSAP